MSATATFRSLGIVVMGAAFLAAPLVHPFGQLWIVAAVSTLTVYEGFRSRVVYGVIAFLFVVELLYGGDVGVVVIAYCTTVPLLLAARRFVSFPVWASSDGWRVGDAVRTVLVSWVMFVCCVAIAVVAGDVLYGFAHIVERLLMLASVRLMSETILVCLVTSIVVRRLSVPFRPDIRFGT